MWNEDGHPRERQPRQRSSLGSEQRARCVREAWPQCCRQEETIGVPGCHRLPTAMSWTDVIRIGEPMRTSTVGQSEPLRRMEPHVLQARTCDECSLEMGVTWSSLFKLSTWCPPPRGDVGGPCARHRPSWSRKTPASGSAPQNQPTQRRWPRWWCLGWMCRAAVPSSS